MKMKTTPRVNAIPNRPPRGTARLTLVRPAKDGDRVGAASSGLRTVIGRLAGWSPAGPLFVLPGEAAEAARPARSLVRLTEAAALEAARRGQEVLVAFAGEPAVPVLVGLLDGAPDGASSPTEVVVDGERLVFQGRREIELRCGAASITLQQDGKVVVKGAYVETRARGVNRIRGGTVKIN